MLKINRQNFIEQELREHGSVLISDLCQKLGCSSETVRRDFNEMEISGKVKRIYGGAYLPEVYDKGVPITLRETFFTKEKEHMANLAINYISDGDVLMLDASSTCLRLAQTLLNIRRKVVIITNSLSICKIFNKYSLSMNVICSGGKLSPKTSSFIGYDTVEMLKNYIADKAFISCPSVDINYGLTDNNFDDAEIRRTMLKQSREHFLIADHTKFTSQSEVTIADLTKIQTLITDHEISPAWKKKCEQLHINVSY